MKEIKLYHGSPEIVRKPLLERSKSTNDYGKGFYCTENIDLAKEWGVSQSNNGVVNEYTLDIDGLNVLYLNTLPLLCWVAILIENRIFYSNSPLVEQGKKLLLKKYLPDYKKYDVIVGYRADDSYFSFAQDFLNGSISIRLLETAMHLGNLGTQVVLKSEKAFSRIKFVRYEIVDKDEWYKKKQTRDSTARQKYSEIKHNSLNDDDIFIADLIRGKKK